MMGPADEEAGGDFAGGGSDHPGGYTSPGPAWEEASAAAPELDDEASAIQ